MMIVRERLTETSTQEKTEIPLRVMLAPIGQALSDPRLSEYIHYRHLIAFPIGRNVVLHGGG